MKHTDILIKLRKIIRSVNLEGKRIEKEYGLSIPQLLCLNFLNGRESYQSPQKEIKEFLSLNASTVTGIISRLEKKGLVARIPHQQDRRVTLITLTAKGAALLEKTPEPLHEQLSLRLKNLPAGQLDSLHQAFDLIIDFLDIEKMDAAPILAPGYEINTDTESN
jgi:DNA-binding MarR family transcriptional regulator